MIELTMLGTGWGLSKRYYNNNALFNLNGYRLLVDCGNTAHRSLHEMGMAWQRDVDGILITHIHADHVGGLEEVALNGKYNFNRKATLYVPQSLVIPLWEHSLKGGVSDPAYGRIEDFFDVVVLGDEPFEIGGERLQLLETLHVPGRKSYSLLIGDLFYSSDVQFDRDLLLSLNDRVSRIFHDCALAPSPVHASLDELLSLPASIQEKIWIMHYSDDLEACRGTRDFGRLHVLEQQRRYVIRE